MIATKLSSAPVAPYKVAKILDRGKALGVVMALDITRERIGSARAEHPDLHGAWNGSESIPLSSISLQQDRNGAYCTKSEVIKGMVSELEAAVGENRVCAFVVNWPIQQGRIGERCGKVLQVLDSVVNQSNGVVTTQRPFTLWCNQASASYDPTPPDKWGRSAGFTRLTDYSPGMVYSSKSAIRDVSPANASMVAANVLDEWVKSHWEVNKMGRAKAPKKEQSNFVFGAHLVEEYNNETATTLKAAHL